MVRVLFFIDRYFPTDHAFIEEVYSRILPQRGYAVTIVARSKTSTGIVTCRWNQARLVLLPSKRKYMSDLLTLKRVRKLMKGDYDIIQVRNDPIFAMLAPPEKLIFQLSHLKAEQFLTEPMARFSNFLKGTSDLLLRKFYLPRARFVFAISAMMKKFLTSNYAINACAVVPLGVGQIRVEQARVDSIRDKYELSGKTAFIYIGTLASSRRLEIVLDAFKKAFQSTGGALALLFLGDAPNRQDVVQLQRKAMNSGNGNIHFIERVPRKHVPNYLAACDVGLATTPVNEVNRCMSPTKTVEYLNSGIPVLATNIPDQVQIVKKSGGGFFCEFSAKDIASKMIAFHHCPIRKTMGDRGRDYVRRIRSYQHISDIVARCCQTMLSSKTK